MSTRLMASRYGGSSGGGGSGILGILDSFGVFDNLKEKRRSKVFAKQLERELEEAKKLLELEHEFAGKGEERKTAEYGKREEKQRQEAERLLKFQRGEEESKLGNTGEALSKVLFSNPELLAELLPNQAGMTFASPAEQGRVLSSVLGNRPATSGLGAPFLKEDISKSRVAAKLSDILGGFYNDKAVQEALREEQIKRGDRSLSPGEDIYATSGVYSGRTPTESITTTSEKTGKMTIDPATGNMIPEVKEVPKLLRTYEPSSFKRKYTQKDIDDEGMSQQQPFIGTDISPRIKTKAPTKSFIGPLLPEDLPPSILTQPPNRSRSFDVPSSPKMIPGLDLDLGELGPIIEEILKRRQGQLRY